MGEHLMLGILSVAVPHSVPSLSDLSSVSLDAAIQLDRIMRKRPADPGPLRKLSEKLRGASDLPSGGTALSLHYNPTALGVLSRAIERSGKTTLGTVSELTTEISQYVDLFSRQPNEWDEPTVVRLLDFCLTLTRELVAEISQPAATLPADDFTGEPGWTS
jgi:hypothetical protein